MVLIIPQKIKNNLLKSLKILRRHIEDKNTDAHKDFFPTKMYEIDNAIKLIKKNRFNFNILIKVSKELSFKRLFPLIELAEKLPELENTVIKQMKILKNSYKIWGIKESQVERIFETHKLLVIKSVLEGIFRKGLVHTDKEAWAPIMYNMGGRTIYDYVYAVTNGWFHEDLVSLWFKNQLGKIKSIRKVSIKRTAHDSNRVFKYKKEKQNITGEPDFLIVVQINKNIFNFFLEVQHVKDASVKKSKNLIQVPPHRVRESKKYGSKYIFIIPYVNNQGKVSDVSVNTGPLKAIDENYIKGYFTPPSESYDLIQKFINKLKKRKVYK